MTKSIPKSIADSIVDSFEGDVALVKKYLESHASAMLSIALSMAVCIADDPGETMALDSATS